MPAFTVHFAITGSVLVDEDEGANTPEAAGEIVRHMPVMELAELAEGQNAVSIQQVVQETAVCSSCGEPCSAQYSMCDRDPEGRWCPSCWPDTPCGLGEHEEDCPTHVFST